MSKPLYVRTAETALRGLRRDVEALKRRAQPAAAAGGIAQMGFFTNPFFGDSIDSTDERSEDWLLWSQSWLGPPGQIDNNGWVYVPLVDTSVGSAPASIYEVKVVIDPPDDPNDPGDGTAPADPKYWDIGLTICYGSPDFPTTPPTGPQTQVWGPIACNHNNLPFQANYTKNVNVPGRQPTAFWESITEIVNNSGYPYCALAVSLTQTHPGDDPGMRQTSVHNGYMQVRLLNG
jgi:hypothetical protein